MRSRCALSVSVRIQDGFNNCNIYSQNTKYLPFVQSLHCNLRCIKYLGIPNSTHFTTHVHIHFKRISQLDITQFNVWVQR